MSIIETTDLSPSTVTGSSWDRCTQIIGLNPREGAPSLIFYMERRTVLADGSEVTQESPPLTSVLIPDNASTEFTIAGKTYTYAEVHAVLYGLLCKLHSDAQDAAQSN